MNQRFKRIDRLNARFLGQNEVVFILKKSNMKIEINFIQNLIGTIFSCLQLEFVQNLF